MDHTSDYYGVGKLIDPTAPFHMKLVFDEDATGEFASYTTTLTQGGTVLNLPSGDCDALSEMTEDM